MKRAVLYLRVSTLDQTTANQERKLREIAEPNGLRNCQSVQGPRHNRRQMPRQTPSFDAALPGRRDRKFDMVMAWSVDRLGRSLQDLVGFLSEFHSFRIDLFLHQQGLDTTTPGRQGHVSDAWRVCRVRALDDSGTSPRRA